MSDEFTSGQFENNNDDNVQAKMNEEAQSGGFGNEQNSGEAQFGNADAGDQQSGGRQASSGSEGQFGNAGGNDQQSAGFGGQQASGGSEGQFGNAGGNDQQSGGFDNDSDSNDSVTGLSGNRAQDDEEFGQSRQGNAGGFGGNNN